MAIDYLNKNGLSYFWSKLKAYFAPKAHTHSVFETKHSYTTAANAAKNWYRIANASTQQLDTSKPIRAQFIVTAYNTSYAADYYETWFVNAIVFGRQAHIIIFGGSGVPFSQARILYENTVANIDANDRPAIDLYLNYVLPNGTTKIEVEEIYNNGGWTFVADGQLAASTVPSGFENITSAPRNNGVNNSTYADYVSYLNRQVSNFTAAFTLADSYLYRSRTLNCTGTFTITIPSINSGYMWCVIKNKNTSSGVITLHPSTTSVLIDGSNADIKLQPMEYVCIHSAGANNYSLIADGRWKSQKANDADVVHITGTETVTGAKTFSSEVKISSVNALRIKSSNYGAFFRNDNSAFYLLVTASGDADGTWTTARPLTVNLSDGKCSINGNAATASAVAWSGITSKPTTISGYGINDAKIANGTITLGSNSITPLTSHQTLPTLSRTISGSGNAITDITVSNHAITATKGATFLTSHQTLPTLSKTDSGSGNAVTAISVSNHAITVTKGSTFALDSDVIHKDSNEAIEGIKEFSNSYYDSTIEGETDWESSSLIIRYQNYIKGSGAPSANKHANLLFLDKVGNNVNWSGRLGAVESGISSSGAYGLSIACYKNEIIDNFDTHDRAMLSVGYDADGIKHASCPSTSSSRTDGGDIVTRDWIPKDTRIVHTTGDETIGGNKTFTSDIFATKYIYSRHGSIIAGTAPNSNAYRDLAFLIHSANGTDWERSSYIEAAWYDSGGSAINIANYDLIDSSRTMAVISIGHDSDGTPFTRAYTPPSNSNSIDIATTAWTNSKYVNLTSAQTVGGEKTFTSGPVIANNSPYITVKDTNGEKGSTAGWALGHWFHDKNNKPLGYIVCARYGTSTDKHNVIGLRAYKCNSASDTDYGQVYLNYYTTPNIAFEPENSNEILLGRNSRKWKEVWCTQSSINSSSDERLKDDIESVPDAVLDAWLGVDWVQYRFRSAKSEKGEGARFHTGAVAQRVDEAFRGAGLDASRYGLFLHDVWDAVPDAFDENGVQMQKAQPAGDEYGLRYVEALCMEAACMRRENARLKKRVSDLEERLAALELRLGSE